MLVRTTLIVILWACNMCLYLARTNITVAVIYMFPHNTNTEGTLLAAFYYGYTLSQVPGGYIATRCGSKITLSCAVLLWSLSTLFTGFVGKSIPVLFCLRLAVGLAEGANYPCQMELISKWIPRDERSRAWSTVISGESIGTILALVGGPFVAHSYGWQSVFWVSGGASLVWLMLFVALTSSLPSIHPRITAEELTYIQEHRPQPRARRARVVTGSPVAQRHQSIPWYDILTNKHVLFVVATHCCYNFGYYVCLSWIQKFFSVCYHAEYNTLGALSVLPYIVIIGCLFLAGNAADRVESYFQWSATRVRKLFNSIGMFGAGFFFFLLSVHAPTHLNPVVVHHPTNTTGSSPSSSSSSSSTGNEVDLKGATTAAVLLALAIGMGGFAAGAGYWPSLGDLSQSHSSIVCGVSNSIASIPGIIGGKMVGNILTSTGNNWSLIFRIAAGVEVLGAVLFIVGGSAEDQQFGRRRGVGGIAEPLVNAIGEND